MSAHSNMDDKDIDATHHELAMDKSLKRHGKGSNPTGTVKLVEDGEIVLIPTPSPDPRGLTSLNFVCENYIANEEGNRPLELPSMAKMGDHVRAGIVYASVPHLSHIPRYHLTQSYQSPSSAS